MKSTIYAFLRLASLHDRDATEKNLAKFLLLLLNPPPGTSHYSCYPLLLQGYFEPIHQVLVVSSGHKDLVLPIVLKDLRFLVNGKYHIF